MDENSEENKEETLVLTRPIRRPKIEVPKGVFCKLESGYQTVFHGHELLPEGGKFLTIYSIYLICQFKKTVAPASRRKMKKTKITNQITATKTFPNQRENRRRLRKHYKLPVIQQKRQEASLKLLGQY